MKERQATEEAAEKWNVALQKCVKVITKSRLRIYWHF
jgi:hypothetical protein